MTRSHIQSNFTFGQLKEKNVTTQDLFLWSAPIDLIERYQNYLDTQTLVSASELFYNCTSLWFGPFCQYTFKSNDPFSNIVHKTFIAKGNDTNGLAVTSITNLTCYAHIKCSRGPSPLCLDWREICDGRIDCLGDGIDEKNCFDLEINECEQNEYRCHNGMCIPEQFVNDHFDNPDCSDHTDEYSNQNNTVRRGLGFSACYRDPTFRCEESDHFFYYRGFVCGDGQQIKLLPFYDTMIYDIAKKMECINGRDNILLRSVLLNPLVSSNLSVNCKLVMIFMTLGTHHIQEACEKFPCVIPMHEFCDQLSYVMLPASPILQGYAQYGYWTNKTVVFEFLGHTPLPDFVCYDRQRCPFLSPDFTVNNLTCRYISSANNSFILEHSIVIFHMCLTVDESGNETGCFHQSLFHCPNTSKCISKHRLVDGIFDCPDGTDEFYTESCNLNHRYRFRCTFENKCISPVLIRDLYNHCHGGEDEYFSYEQNLHFQNLCNGYIHFLPLLIDGRNETDETNCEQWPCNNQYTQCDRAWTCPNGADEINCNPASKCYPNQHECVSPETFKSTCLLMNKTGDGKVDCLGATDEREYCRRMHPKAPWVRYQCWNDTVCTATDCNGLNECPFEKNNSIQEICDADEHIANLLLESAADMWLGNEYVYKNKYFVLQNLSRFRLNTLFTRVIIANDSWFKRGESISYNHTEFSFKFVPKEIDLRRAWFCNRGIVVFSGIQETELCLCPPSYYGNRCEFQNQRVSLTLQFSKECAPLCDGAYGIVVTLVDNDQEIHSYEQLTYISTNNCDMKHNLYLLYRSRPKNLTKNYTIQIHAYNKIDLTYHSSWILPVKLLFLPVNRIAAYLIIPAHPVGTPDNCPLVCGDHGRCTVYSNTGEYFCHCNSNWSGSNCSIPEEKCDCSVDSICLGKVNNRSICLCSSNKSSPRCFIYSVCRDNPCKNGGQCIPEDDRLSMHSFTCICGSGYSGSICDVKDTSIQISFTNVKIPQSLMIHMTTVQANNDPLLTTIAKKVALDQDSVILYTSVLFNLVFVQIDTEFFLAFLQVNTSRLAHIGLDMKTLHHCPIVQSLFDDRTNKFPLLRRVKYYHTLCKNHAQLTCLHDNEAFICLCNEDDYANCFPFDYSKVSICAGRTICENKARCLPNRPTCPTSTMCICPDCFYGGRCQFTTKTFSLSLDIILGYHIRPYLKLVQQTMVVKVSIVLTTLILVLGLIDGILSIMTFQLKKLRDVGCGLYLLVLSISSLISTLVFTLKFWLLISSQIGWITNRTTLFINCISLEFILQSLLTIGDWLSACVAIERMFVVIKGVNFNQAKSKQTARWVIISVVLCIFLSLVHDPIHRQLIHDEEEQRTWCIVQYSSKIKVFDSIVHILHFFIPFSINIISAIIIVIMVARTHSTTRKRQSYQQHLRKQFHEHKHLIISPIILVILAFPRLAISFVSGCMKSIRDPWLYLIGYFISFIPPLLTFVVFIWPSATYKKEFDTIIKRYRTGIRRRLHCV